MALAQALSAEADDFVSVHRNRILRISGIYCSEPVGEPRSVTCKATYHYRNGPSFEMVRVVKGADAGKSRTA